MARRQSPAPAGAQSPKSLSFPAAPNPAGVPKLDEVQAAIDDESNVARLLHRMALDVRENLPEGTPGDLQSDIDAFVSELGRLETRLGALAESLDVAGGAEIVRKRLHAVAGQGAA